MDFPKPPQEVVELERLADDAQLSMSEVCQYAKVPYTAWWRWRNRGVDPRTSSLRKLRNAISEMKSDYRGADAE